MYNGQYIVYVHNDKFKLWGIESLTIVREREQKSTWEEIGRVKSR